MSTAPESLADVTWRQLERHLWVGRREDRHVGMVEEGRRFTFVEPCGTAHPGYASLAEAQRVADEPAAAPMPARDPLLTSSGVLLLSEIVAAAGTLAVLAAVGWSQLR